jgi:hypothetical protein
MIVRVALKRRSKPPFAFRQFNLERWRRRSSFVTPNCLVAEFFQHPGHLWFVGVARVF